MTPIYDCPSRLAKQAAFVLDSFWMFKQGFLPVDGGYLEQTKNFWDVVRLIDSDINKAMKK